MNLTNISEYDVAVVGGGHAGCEASLAAARMGMKTVMFAINLDSIAMMPCNPNIGGSSKGIIVREIDALGGEMGKNIDKTYIQNRMLNKSKGPAVYSLRAQADKYQYTQAMKSVLEETENLSVVQGEVTEILTENNQITGVISETGRIYKAKAVILCTGTYLNARCLCGSTITYSGPNGLKASKRLSENMADIGIKMFRFKTGTPPRINGRTVDYAKMSEQPGDNPVNPFSFENTPESIAREQESCYLTYTNEHTHNIIKDNLDRSPMYSGVIEGTGARYCPSIEDKVMRFADKERHQIFIEPEGLQTNEMYVQGMSTSLPEDVQEAMLRTVPGLENCQIMRLGYAIEYDCIDATQLELSLEFKNNKGLFAAGQLNGSSGYEEAAAQGLMAGINAALKIQGKAPLVLQRYEGYIGVLIDDLVTKGTNEPYRMMTSRAEYRLLLRQDNADRRLTPKAYEIGLITQERYNNFLQKELQITEEISRLNQIIISPSEEVNRLLEEHNTTPITSGVKLPDLIKRPELSYQILKPLDPNRPDLDYAVSEQVNITIKYEGYIKRQQDQVEQFKKLVEKKLPKDIDYENMQGLRIEAAQKLAKIRPENLGQASGISGVTPADIAVLTVRLHMK